MKRFTPIPISNEFDMPAIRIVEDKEGRYVRHKDAIAEIEALKVQIEVLQSALRRTIRVWLVDENRALRAKLPRWIPVTERLPHETESRYVIVACSTGAVRETIYCPNSDFFKRRFERTWNSDPISGLFECGAEFGYTITHWMPLPAAPEQEPSV